MLTKKQKRQLDRMQEKYISGMMRTSIAPYDLMVSWSQRYRIAMQMELEKQGKH